MPMLNDADASAQQTAGAALQHGVNFAPFCNTAAAVDFDSYDPGKPAGLDPPAPIARQGRRGARVHRHYPARLSLRRRGPEPPAPLIFVRGAVLDSPGQDLADPFDGSAGHPEIKNHEF